MVAETISTVKLIFTKKMMFFNMQLAWTGTTIAYFNAMLIPIMILELHDHKELDDD